MPSFLRHTHSIHIYARLARTPQQAVSLARLLPYVSIIGICWMNGLYVPGGISNNFFSRLRLPRFWFYVWLPLPLPYFSISLFLALALAPRGLQFSVSGPPFSCFFASPPRGPVSFTRPISPLSLCGWNLSDFTLLLLLLLHEDTNTQTYGFICTCIYLLMAYFCLFMYSYAMSKIIVNMLIKHAPQQCVCVLSLSTPHSPLSLCQHSASFFIRGDPIELPANMVC